MINLLKVPWFDISFRDQASPCRKNKACRGFRGQDVRSVGRLGDFPGHVKPQSFEVLTGYPAIGCSPKIKFDNPARRSFELTINLNSSDPGLSILAGLGQNGRNSPNALVIWPTKGLLAAENRPGCPHKMAAVSRCRPLKAAKIFANRQFSGPRVAVTLDENGYAGHDFLAEGLNRQPSVGVG
jgi:hypothetical protein